MNPRRQILVSAIAAVVVTVLFFVFILKPKLAEIADAQRDTEQAIDQESNLRTELARLESLRRQQPQIQAKLARLRAYLPPSPDLPGFIRLVQSAATSSGVDLASISPSQPSELPEARGISTITATLTVQGGFHRMTNLLSKLENLSRVVEVRSISLTPISEQGRTVLDGTIGLTMYVVADDAALTGRAAPRPTPTAEAGR